ncbi:hypothetical protein ACWGR4_07450 [Embleya sp. NPDC055664]
MSSYYVQYSDRARSEYAALSASTRLDPPRLRPRGSRHGPRSLRPRRRHPRNKDRRSACLAGVITEYEISRDVLVVTMLKVVGI